MGKAVGFAMGKAVGFAMGKAVGFAIGYGLGTALGGAEQQGHQKAVLEGQQMLLPAQIVPS